MSSIASRASWGARYRDGVGNRPTGRLEKYLHHTVTAHLPITATVAQERTQMRIIERIGQERFGAGISYNFLIFPSGRIYEGASVGRISYHSGAGRNTRGVGFCLAGNYDQFRLGTPGFNAAVWLLQEGVRRGWWGDPALTSMHRDFRATSCPGRYAAERFSEINRAGRSGTTPTPSPGGNTVSASDVWNYRGRDYVNDSPVLKDTQIARAHQYAYEAPERVWSHRDRDFVNENPNSYGFMLARIHQYVWEQRAKIRNIESDLAGLRAAMEAMAAAEGDHVYEAVTNALKDHDERTVRVEVTVNEPEENEA